MGKTKIGAEFLPWVLCVSDGQWGGVAEREKVKEIPQPVTAQDLVIIISLNVLVLTGSEPGCHSRRLCEPLPTSLCASEPHPAPDLSPPHS